MKKLTALIILDGFGYRSEKEGNAILLAGIPAIMELAKKYPHTLIDASGLSVGLPEGQMGNSEVGHTNIGAGRIVYQSLTRITKAIKDGDFFTNTAFKSAVENCIKHESSLHIMGLCSDGGVHSVLEHMYAVIDMAKSSGIKKVYIHCFTDGRDVPPDSGASYIEAIQEKLIELDCGKIATICGRYYAMDRDNRYDRVEKAYAAMVHGEGNYAADPVGAIKESYKNGISDEFILPTVITENGEAVAKIKRNDSIIFFNFRPDRARELTRAFVAEEFAGFERKTGYFPVNFVCMTQYDAEFDDKVSIAFKPMSIQKSFGEYVSSLGMKQLRIAETEKYAHVTFFFNGGVETKYPGEDRVLIPSPKVATYDLKPEMSAYEVASEAIKRIRSREYDVMILNFANPDMVGHTGVIEATKTAIKAVDECVDDVVSEILKNDGKCIITADHGNAEMMLLSDGAPMTAHSVCPVPFILVDPELISCELRQRGRLCDIAPTMLDMMGLEIPSEMSGESLIIR